MTVLAAPISVPQPSAAPDISKPVQTVLARLDSPVHKRSASPIVSCVAAIASFGLLPLWIWPQRWQSAAEEDRRDLAALASWWQPKLSSVQAKRLDSATRRLGSGAAVTSVLLTAVALGSSLLLTWSFFHGLTLERAIEITYQQRPLLHVSHARSETLQLGQLWIALLCVAYALHYLAMRSHTAAVNRLAKAIDAATETLGIQGTPARYAYSGIGPLWITCGLLMCGAGLWWGAPLVLAGARQRQYLRRVRPAMRRDLANQLRAAVGQRSLRLGTCSTPACRATLPPAARFCPRCGAAV